MNKGKSDPKNMDGQSSNKNRTKKLKKPDTSFGTVESLGNKTVSTSKKNETSSAIDKILTFLKNLIPGAEEEVEGEGEEGEDEEEKNNSSKPVKIPKKLRKDKNLTDQAIIKVHKKERTKKLGTLPSDSTLSDSEDKNSNITKKNSEDKLNKKKKPKKAGALSS